MNLGDRIVAWREWRGMNQRQLAEAADVSRGSMCQYEGRGEYRTAPSQRALAAIVAALGLTMAKFYGPVPKRKRAA